MRYYLVEMTSIEYEAERFCRVFVLDETKETFKDYRWHLEQIICSEIKGLSLNYKDAVKTGKCDAEYIERITEVTNIRPLNL